MSNHCTCQTNPYGVHGCPTHNLFSASSHHLASVHPEPPPAKNERMAVWGVVIEDMRQRDAFGREKYGTPLQPFNGRDALVDAYQEALDLVVYLKQAILEKAEERAGPQKPCGCGAMFALKALVEATAARWSAGRERDGAFLDALGRAQALTGLPPFDRDEEPER